MRTVESSREKVPYITSVRKSLDNGRLTDKRNKVAMALYLEGS